MISRIASFTSWLPVLLVAWGPLAAQPSKPAPAEPTPAETAGEPTAPSEPAGQAAPLPPPGEMARCKLLIDYGHHLAARKRLEPIVEQHPKWARATSLLALTYYKEKRFEVARDLFARALELDPDEIAARPFYGWSLYSLGDLDGAQAMFESLLARKADFAAGHYSLGVVLLDRDEVEAARRSLETAVELASGQDDRPMEGRARARLGDLHVRLDDLDSAKRELEAAVELFPDEREAWFKLSRVRQRLGDAEGAAAALEKFEELKEKPAPPLLPFG